MWTKVVLLVLCILYLSSGVAKGNDEVQTAQEAIIVQEAEASLEEQEEAKKPEKRKNYLS